VSDALTPVGDAAAALAWSVTNVLLFTCAWRVGRRLFPADAGLATLLHAVVLGVAFISAVVLALGGLGLLYPWAAIGVVLCGSAAGLRVLGRWPGGPLPQQPAGSAGPVSPVWAVLWGALSAFLLGHVGVSGLATFPTDVDSLTYHIPLIRHWLQAHGLYAPESSHWSVPGNLEVVGLWVVGPFSGDFLAPLTNFPFAVVLALGVVELAKALRLSPLLCHAAGLAAVANFIVFRQLLDVENDIPVVALFVACLAYGLRHLRGRCAADLLLGAVCFGLLCGVKYYALGYAGVAWGGLTVCVALGHGLRAGGRFGLAGLVAAAVLAGYWYARNWVVTGSPLYPVWAGSGPGVGEVYPDVWATTLVGYGRADAADLYAEAVWKMVGPVGYVALLAAPAAVAWVAWTAARAARRCLVGALGRGVVVVAAVGCSGLVLVTPFLVENIPHTQNQLREAWTPVRYSLCPLTLAVVMLAVCVSDVVACRRLRAVSVTARVRFAYGAASRSLRLTASAAVVPAVALAALAFVQLVTVDRAGWLPMQPADALLLGSNVFGVGVAAAVVSSGRRQPRWWVGGPGAVFVLTAVGVVPLLSARWHAGFAEFYDSHYGTRAFSQLRSVPPDRGLCLVNLTEVYPFFGSRGDVRVVQPVRADTPGRLADYLEASGVEVMGTKTRLTGFDAVWARAPWLDEAYLARRYADAGVPVSPGIGLFLSGGPGGFDLRPWRAGVAPGPSALAPAPPAPGPAVAAGGRDQVPGGP
jgi:hypothetical protein